MVQEIDSFVGISYKPVRFENMEELYDSTGDRKKSLLTSSTVIDVVISRNG
jgi:hypothetical protein